MWSATRRRLLPSHPQLFQAHPLEFNARTIGAAQRHEARTAAGSVFELNPQLQIDCSHHTRPPISINIWGGNLQDADAPPHIHDTPPEHTFRTHFHTFRTHLQGTPSGHTTHLQDTPSGHASRAHLEIQDTSSGHNPRTHLQDTPPGHTCRTHLQDTTPSHTFRTRLQEHAETCADIAQA